MADTLTAIGQTVEASDVVAYILTGLPSEYDSLVAAVTTLIEIVTVDALYGFLLSHELRLEQQTATAELGQPTANLANRTISNSGRGGSRPPFFNNSHGGPSKGRGAWSRKRSSILFQCPQSARHPSFLPNLSQG